MLKGLVYLLSSLVVPGSRVQEQNPPELREICIACSANLTNAPLYLRHRVCPSCRFHYSLTARERVELLTDPVSFRETNRSLISLDPISFSGRISYRQQLFLDQRRTGLAEAVVTGRCTVGGAPAMLILLDFSFMGGTMGSVAGEKVAQALEQAAKKKLPVIAVVTSAGARIQEGVLSLMQMAKTATAVNRLHKEGLPFITLLANPATGPAYASFANLADIILAEPGALVGFAPMRTIEEVTGKPVPEGAHTAESHLVHGMIDNIVDRAYLPELLAFLLDLLMPQFVLSRRTKSKRWEPKLPPVRLEPWQSVQLARHTQRATSRDYIRRMTASFFELHGDRMYGDDSTVVCGLGFLGGQSVVIIGQERLQSPDQETQPGGQTFPEGLRKAQRVMRLAAKLQVPIVTLIDTPGAHPALEAEERGIGNAIASTLATMAKVPTPIVSAIIGEGGSEGALALSLADRIVMLENAIYSPISPEAAAALLYRDIGRADEMAASLKLTAADAKELRIVDAVVPEPEGGAHLNHADAARILERAILRALSELQNTPAKKLLKARYKKFRNMGEYSSYFHMPPMREASQPQ